MTLEGLTAIMRSYLKCTDAIILDEGFDPFVLRNPRDDGVRFRYTNNDILNTLGVFSLSLHKKEQDGYLANKDNKDEFGPTIAEWPKNKPLFTDLKRFVGGLDSKPRQSAEAGSDELFLSKPLRCQTRAVLIFAEKHGNTKGPI
ncbi:MAG: hypothetical protein HW373_1563 [Deltaproteobacteria bacterium]|nr:hypothetical protein [Deltaproteobacteria bacterium]